MKSLRVIFHYPDDDTKFRSDCLQVDFIVDGRLTPVEVVQCEDYPIGEALAFIEGVKMAAPFCQITEEKVADLEC